MASKQDDHNQGQRDGAKAGGLDEFLVMNSPLESPEYKQGFKEGRRKQIEAKAKEKVEFIGTRDRQSDRLDYGGGSGGGGGGAGGGGGPPIIRGLVLIFVIGFVLYVSEDYRRHHPEHVEVDITVLDADGHRPIRFLEYKPGAHQKVNFSITWKGGLQYKKKPFVLSLLRNSKTVFTRQIESDDKGPLGFYLPYNSELQRGRYVARVSVEGVGTRDYDFAVGTEKDIIEGIKLRDPPVQPAVANGLSIFVTDSFQGNHPWPPKNVIYTVSAEPKWLYATVQSNALSGAATSVNATVICGASPLVTQPSEIKPNSMVYFSLEQKLTAGHCAERVFLDNGTYVEFPFIVVEVERGSKPEEYKIVHDPDSEQPIVSSAWVQRGMEHSRTGQHDAAIRDFSVAIPDETVAYHLRGNEYAALGNYERAIADYDFTLQRQPHNVSCLVSRGSAYANLRNYERAIVDFKEAARINPQYQAALEQLTRAQQELTAQQAVSISPEKTLDSSPDATETVPNLDCYIGAWYDNVGNLWMFTQAGDSLNLHRPSDGSTGTFHWTGTQWQGSVSLPRMKIVSGEFTLQSLDESCTRLRTSMAMYFVRRPGE